MTRKAASETDVTAPLLAAIRELSSAVILRYARSHEVVGASAGVQALLHLSRDQLTGSRAEWESRIPDDEEVAALGDALAAAEQGGRHEARYRITDGRGLETVVREIVWSPPEARGAWLLSELSIPDVERRDAIDVTGRSLQMLHRIWDAFATSESSDEALRAAAMALTELTGFDQVRVYHPTGADGWRQAAKDGADEFTAAAHDPIRRALACSRPLWIESMAEETDWPRRDGLIEEGWCSGLYFTIQTQAPIGIVVELLSQRTLAVEEGLLDTLVDIAGVLSGMMQREHAEYVRQRSERLFRLTIESAYDAFISIDDQGSVTEWNRRSEEMFGWSREEAIGRKLTELIIPESFHEAHRNGMERFMRTAVGRVMNQRLSLPARCRDGSNIKVELIIWPVQIGGSWAFSAFLHDVTERDRLEEERTQRERELQQAQRLAKLGSWEWDMAADRVNWSDELYRIFEEEPGAFQPTYRAYLDKVHPDDRELVDRTVRRSAETGEPFAHQPRFVGKHGSVKWVLSQGEVVTDAEGRPIGMRGICQDITQRVELEERRRQLEVELAANEEAGRAREALLRSAEQYRFMTNSIPQHVWTAGPDGELEFLNQVGLEFFGLEAEELTTERWLEQVHPEDRPSFAETLDRARETGTDYETAVRLRRSDGEYRWFLSRANPQRDKTGKIIRWYGTNTDIHARKAAEEAKQQAVSELAATNAMLASERALLQDRTEQLQALTAALAASNRDLDQFAYVASHDLRAPLRGIANLSRFLEEDLQGKLTEQTEELLRLLRNRVERMEGLIDGILTYSRAGRTIPEPQTVHVGDLVREVIGLLSVDPSVTIRLAPDLPVINTAVAPLEQVFLNLIGNAVKYGTIDGDGLIEIDWADRGDRVEFSVRDHGPGIAPGLHNRIWHIFQTLEADDDRRGTGLGLSVVQKLVDRFGGTVRLESIEGQGATFFFDWPKDISPLAQPEAVGH